MTSPHLLGHLAQAGLVNAADLNGGFGTGAAAGLPVIPAG
jgi:rhodanese-related sulfurtransferase